MIDIAVFRSTQHSSTYMAMMKYFGTDLWEEQFPVREDLQDILYNSEARRNPDWVPSVEWIPVASPDGKTISPSSLVASLPEVGRFPITYYDFYSWRLDMDNYKWQALIKKYPVAGWAKEKGYCPLCHHNEGLMYVLGNKKGDYRVPLAQRCIHALLMPKPQPKRNSRSASFSN